MVGVEPLTPMLLAQDAVRGHHLAEQRPHRGLGRAVRHGGLASALAWTSSAVRKLGSECRAARSASR